MNDQTLKKANELKKKIQAKKNEIHDWEYCTDYRNNGFVELSRSGLQTFFVKFSSFLSFDEAKKMALDYLNAELNALMEEFERL